MAAPILRIGPANSAGQADAWAEAARRHAGIEARSFSNSTRLSGTGRSSGFRFTTDFTMPYAHFPLRRRALKNVLAGGSHLMWDGFKPLTRTPRSKNSNFEARWLESAGVTTGIISHGSEVRDPLRHLELYRDSYFNVAGKSYTMELSKIASENRRFAESSGLPLFVSTPDLLIDLPKAQWLPLTLPAGWGVEERRRRVHNSGAMKVAHLPSTRSPSIKGSQKIEATLEFLDRTGVIEWVSSDRMTNREVASFFSSVDVVVDQLGTMSYGRTTVEAMSVGAIAVVQLSEQVKSHLGDVRGPVMSSFDQLEDTLVRLAADEAQRQKTVQEGDRFIMRFHDGRRSAEVIADFVGISHWVS